MQMSERRHDIARTLAPHRADDITGLARRRIGTFHQGEVAFFRRTAERRDVPPISLRNRHRRHAARRRPGPRCAAGRTTYSGFLKAYIGPPALRREDRQTVVWGKWWALR